MFTRMLPRGVPELLLFLILIGVGVLLVRSVRNRRRFDVKESTIDLPNLTTQQRVTGTVRRVFRDTVQGIWMVEALVRNRPFVFCATDYETSEARYHEFARSKANKADIALYALATLAPGGVEAMREQIKNADKLELPPDFVTLKQEGSLPNDYVVIGRILDARQERWDETNLTVYRTQVVRSDALEMVIDLAVLQEETAEILPSQSLAHGSARLFGYLAT